MEERSAIAKRLLSYHDRVDAMLDWMIHDKISKNDNINLLKNQLHNYTHDINFKKSQNMGEILKSALDFVRRNYETINTNYL